MEQYIAKVTEIMREADQLFQTTGGSTRHYVRDLLLPMFEQAGLKIVDAEPSPAKAEQEGLRWVKATMFNYKPNSRYYARWGDGDGAIKSTGWFQQSDGTFFWNENGFVPVLRKEHEQLYILDESTTPPVKEAGQPAGEIDIAKYTLWVFTEVVGWDKADHTFRLHGEIEHRPISDLYPKYLESQNNKP